MTREELTRRFKQFQSKITQGKLHVAQHLRDDFERSFSKVKLAPDGLIDESTLDGHVRTTLLAVAFMADREECKEAVSLKDIQAAYFDRLERMFRQPFEFMQGAKADPYHFAGWFASDQTRVKQNLAIFDEFIQGTVEFWDNVGDPTWIHMEDSFDTKAVFTGEIFPDAGSNVISSTGIYFDTTVLPDPFLKIAPILPRMDEAMRIEEVLRLGLQAMVFRDLAIANLATPLVVVLPDRHSLDENYKEFVQHRAFQDALHHANDLFGRNFCDTDELTEFLMRLNTSSEIVSAIKKPNKLVFSTEWGGDLGSHIDRYLAENQSTLGISHPGHAVFLQLFTRFSQANDSYQRSRELRGTPVIHAETSWRWFNWMLRHNALAENSETLSTLHVARALGTTVKSEISWLGNVPPAALLEIRQVGALEEIRALLSEGISELVAARPDNFHRTGDKVFDNLHSAFRNHEEKLKKLSAKKWKFAGLDVGSFLVVGGIEMTAALTGLPLFGAAAVTASSLGIVPTVKDLKDKLGKITEEGKALSDTGVGILLKHRSDA